MSKKLKDRKKLDRIHCKSVAKSISEILRFSTNEHFRKQTFQQFGVFSTKETEKEIKRRLKLIIKNKNLENDNLNPRITEFFPKASEDEISNTQHEHTKENSSSNKTTNDESKILNTSSNICKRSWLQTSSEKYKKNLEFLKKQKLSCFSQPVLSERQNEFSEFQFHSCQIYSNDSQQNNSTPNMSSGSSLSQDTSSSELTDESRYWKMRFKQSLKDNIHKYFKNLKMEKYPDI